MTERSINRLRFKFIIFFMIMFAVVIFIFAFAIDAVNEASTNRTIRDALDRIAKTGGEIPERMEDEGNEFSPEFHYSARYFTVFCKGEKIVKVSTDHIASVNEKTAKKLAKNVIKSGEKDGNSGVYYYTARTNGNNSIIIFLDCTAQIESGKRLTYNILRIIAPSLFIIFLISLGVSKLIVKPEVENVQNQNRFITNASHELKTPLSIIKANNGIIEMMNGSSEWTESTKAQTDRLEELIKNLISASKNQEKEDRNVCTDLSDDVISSVQSFESVAKSQKKTIICSADENIMAKMSREKALQLISLLMDNAMKYCDTSGTVSVSLKKQRGKAILVISNSFADGDKTNCDKFFERFYRQDESHNIDTGGFGIGLSVVQEILRSCRGSIRAKWEKGIISFICVVPAGKPEKRTLETTAEIKTHEKTGSDIF